jgi:hypothetical protein
MLPLSRKWVENNDGATPVQPPITVPHAAVSVWLPRS